MMEPPEVERLTWRMVLRGGTATQPAPLPPAILTVAPRFRHENMPDEVGLLLPTGGGPQALIDAVAGGSAPCGETGLGLFLAGPFLNIRRDGARLARAGVRWIVNLPSVAQQDEEFARQLAEVGLHQARELDGLAAFRDHGFRIAAVVADGPGAAAAAAIRPDAMIVLPRIADFAAGFPSLRQRGAATQAVAEATQAADWSGPLLGLATEAEADRERHWPHRLAGVLCRPVPA